MDTHIIAYLAGAIDSDGSIGIKRSTYHIRVRKDAGNPVFSERVMLKQVTPQIPELLHQCFGGYYRLETASCKQNGKPLYSWQCTDKQAAFVCETLLPHLRVKKRQAEILLELRESKQCSYTKPSYWFIKEHPDWQKEELITTDQALEILGYKNPGSLSQAIRNGTLISLPYQRDYIKKPRFPRILVECLVSLMSTDGRAIKRPPQLIAWRENLCEEIRHLNKIGIYGTEIFRREGTHAPL